MQEREYPAFSRAEMARRRGALTDVLGERGIDAVLVYGCDRSGSAVPWLTGWPVTREGSSSGSSCPVHPCVYQMWSSVLVFG